MISNHLKEVTIFMCRIYNLNRLHDSNPLYSILWRLLFKPWGTGPGHAVQNPLGKGRISLRSGFKMLNFKANHRKVVATEKSLLIGSANPHSASSAHWNMALRVDGAGTELACESESAILKISGAGGARAVRLGGEVSVSPTGNCVELLTERKIKEKVLALLEQAESGARIDLSMFYLSDRDVIRALIRARQRGCTIRVILDPANDAFGRIKNGIPNRQSAAKLVKAGIQVRWADTHGEQCHVKTLYVEHADETAMLLLGSCNYTRRNMNNYNGECDLALTSPATNENMRRARRIFDRWWGNQQGRNYTVEYKIFEDSSLRRRFRAWLMERMGMGTF